MNEPASTNAPTPLPPERLRRRTDPARLGFETTAELPELAHIVGQDRAVEAIGLGLGIAREGFNIFALGPPGVGKHETVERLVRQQAAQQGTPSDWCYVNHFEDPHRPRALRLPSGHAVAFRADVEKLVEELRGSIPAAFESEDYRGRKKLLESQLEERGERAFADVEKAARERGIALVRTPVGVALAPLRDGEVMEAEEFQKLPDGEQERLRGEMAQLQKQLQEALALLPAAAREHKEALKKLNAEVARFATRTLVEERRARYRELPEVLEYLDALERDVVDSVEAFLQTPGGSPDPLAALLARRTGDGRFFRRYGVNVMVDHRETRGAPVVYEDHPTVGNLIGRVEHLPEQGSLVTDFNLIRAGALHRANGGYLILDARKLLSQPFAWDELKRALRSRQLRVESLQQTLSYIATVTLEPKPIPLDLKLVLIGERILYYLLSAYDPDFPDLFKTAADFEDAVDRDTDGEHQYGRIVGAMARREKLRPFRNTAVARLVEEGARHAADGEKLTARLELIRDLMIEADHLAGGRGAETVEAKDVKAAYEAQLRRAGRLRERALEQFRRGLILVDTDKTAVGQVNGLSVLPFGPGTFGRPSRITARVRLGTGQLVDIEREVALGGPIHSKGVLILSGFLGQRYSAERPLSLAASLVFEQSYGGVEGDSASCAELLALLSALAEVALRQDLAVTGSVNQQGQVQAVGGVNDKIEGFFDVCRDRGLSGTQGVLLPAANVQDLMLREEVVEAARAGRFHVYPIASVDEAIRLLSGLEPGERGADGSFPEGSFNARVEARLASFAEKARSFRATPKNNAGEADKARPATPAPEKAP